MAEYAGLEIRIGGNTTKLNNALKASTKSAAELQSRIRQITRAMQFDPTNLKNVETRIKLTGDRMQSLQAKSQIAKTAMEQLGDTMTGVFDEKGKPKSVRKIAEETDNLSLAAKQADERYNKLTGSLAEVYEAWNRISRSEGEDFARDKLGIDAKTAEYLMRTTTSLSDFRAELDRINDARSNGLDVGKDVIKPEQLATLTKFKELNFHDMFKNGLGLDDVIQQARDLGVAISDDAIANVRELQKTFKNASEEKAAFDDALRFEQLGTDIQRIDSEAESLSQTMRQLDDRLNATGSSERYQDLAAEIRKVDAALDNVESDLQRTEEAMKVDPRNIQLAARYMQDLQQKSDLAEQKTELLKNQLNLLDTNGAGEAAKQHHDLAKWVEESAENARVAKKELSEQQATVANLSDSLKDAQRYLDTYRKDRTLAEASDNVQNLTKNTKLLAKAEEDLESARSTHKKNNADVEQYSKKLEDAKKRADELAESERKLSEERDRINRMLMDVENPAYSTDDLIAANSRWGELPAEFESIGRESKEASTKVVELESALGMAQERFKTSAKSVNDCEDRISELSVSIDKLKQTREVKLLGEPEKEIEDEERAISKLKGELEEARAEEKKRQAAYDSAAAENNLAKEAKAFDEVERQTEEAKVKIIEAQEAMGKGTGNIINPSTLKTVGMTLSATLTPLLSGIGYKMVDASSTVDAAYRDMRKTVEGTEEQFEHLKAAAIDFSRTHVTSADQILQIEAIGGELGIATENLETFAEVISNIDVATNLDTESAADALGHLSNILHLTEEDYVGFSDALVRLGNNGASTETEIANIAERIGSMGSIVGMSGSDILAWSSTIASTGQNAEAAGTAISRTMSFFETAVAAAGGTMDASFDTINAAVEEGGDKLTVFASLAGKSADEFATEWETNSEGMASELAKQLESAKGGLQMIADVAHMSADEFAKSWEEDPTEVFKAFIEGLNDIEASGGSADKVLQDLGIKAVRQKQAIEGLMQTVGGLDDNLKMSEDAWNGVSDQWGKAGDAANEAAKKAEGFSGQVQILKNVAQNFFAELGEGAAPWIKDLSGTLEGMSKAFSSLSVDTKKWIVAVGGITAAAGPAISMFATMLTSTGEIKKWFDETTSGANLVKLAFKQSGKVVDEAALSNMSNIKKLGLVAGSVGSSVLEAVAPFAVIAGVALLAKGLKDLYDRYQDHISATKGLSDALSDVGSVSDITAASFDMTGSSLRDLASDSREYESRLADLAKTIEDSNRQYGTFAGQMDYYASTIETLGGKADRSQEETYKLESALQAVNDACGTTYGLDNYGNIIDTQTGKVQENNDAILANIDLRKQQALVDYYSDDYSKAASEWAEAQDKLNDAQAKYDELVSDSGRNAYFDHAKEVYGATYDAAKIQAAYNKEVSDAEEAIRNYTSESNRAQDAMSVLEGKLSAATEGQRKASEAIEKAAAAQEEYDSRTETVANDVTGNMKRMSDAFGELGTDDAGFNAMAAGLDAISVSASELNNVDMSKLVSAYSDAGSSMSDVVATLEEGGVQMTTWNSALEAAPGAAENMGSVTAAAFQAMYDAAGQNINDTMTLIAGLDMVQVGDKTFYIGDNGSITDEQGKVYNIKTDLDSIPDEVITAYYVDDKEALKKAQDAKKKTDDYSKQKATAKLEAKDNASKKVDTLKSKLNDVNKLTPTPTVNLRDNASGTIGAISRNLTNLDGKVSTVTIKTVEKKVKQATGGMNNRPVIPEHATGYIATGPTLTNQGWIGEDGTEAVANWATGGAVVPLTNKKYMLPIADAIADGMSKRMGGGGNQISVTVTGVSSPDEVADAIARKLTVLNL